VHLTAPFRILRAAAKAKEEAAGNEVFRKVVNISSIAGTGGDAGQINYSAAKAGILGVTRAMPKEWGALQGDLLSWAGLARHRRRPRRSSVLFAGVERHLGQYVVCGDGFTIWSVPPVFPAAQASYAPLWWGWPCMVARLD